MDIIYDIKRGEIVPEDIFDPIITEMQENGSKAVILGCTELCVITDNARDNARVNARGRTDTRCTSQRISFISILDVLAEASISFFRDK